MALERIVLLVGVALLGLGVPRDGRAATCVWNAASGNFNVAANWTGCADVPGPSTRSPGANDIALVANGTVLLTTDQNVSELEIGPGALLSVTGGLPFFTVTGALRFAGGATTTILGENQLRFVLPAGAVGTLTATTILDQATFIENSGTLNLGSASSAALKLKTASQITNMPGSTLTLAGGDSRLYLDDSTRLINEPGATITVSGTAVIGKEMPDQGLPLFRNYGQVTLTGPGTLTLAGGAPSGAGWIRFDQCGRLEIADATLVCNGVAAQCLWGGLSECSDFNTLVVTVLDDATIDNGGPGAFYPLFNGAHLSGTGTIAGGLGQLQGTLEIGGSGPPYGTLTVTGGVDMSSQGTLAFDLGGNTLGGYDRLVVGGQVQVGNSGSVNGMGRLRLTLAPGYAPPLNEAVPLIDYAGVSPDPGFNLIEANATRDYAVRFDPAQMLAFPAPRLVFNDAGLIEGNSGTSMRTVDIGLSEPTSQTVTLEVRSSTGTAQSGSPPSGDYNAGFQTATFTPGQTLRTLQVFVNGDTAVEADEAFVMGVYRNRLTNAAFGNGFRGARYAEIAILTDDLPPNTRFLLLGMDSSTAGVRRYTTDGQFIDRWDTRQAGFPAPNTGMCFAANGDVLATRFVQAAAGPILFTRFGAPRIGSFGGGGGLFFNQHESCVYDAAGNVYIGQAGLNSSVPDVQVPILKFSPTGVLLDSYVVPTGERGTDWIDLSANQCTMYYTSEDDTVRRYDVCTRTVLPLFVTGLAGEPCYALRLRPNSELMVACQDAVHRISAAGTVVQSHTRQSIGETSAQGLFALNLDPDGTSFWTAGGTSGGVYRIDIASGAVLRTFNTGMGGVAGMAVYDELRETDVLLVDGFEGSAPGARAATPVPMKSVEPSGGHEDPHYALPRRVRAIPER